MIKQPQVFLDRPRPPALLPAPGLLSGSILEVEDTALMSAVSDAERRARYASHRELLGQRSYEQSVEVLDRWLRLRKVRTELEEW